VRSPGEARVAALAIFLPGQTGRKAPFPIRRSVASRTFAATLTLQLATRSTPPLPGPSWWVERAPWHPLWPRCFALLLQLVRLKSRVSMVSLAHLDHFATSNRAPMAPTWPVSAGTPLPDSESRLERLFSKASILRRFPFRFLLLPRQRLPFCVLRHRPMAPRLPFCVLPHRPMGQRLPFRFLFRSRLPLRFLPHRPMGQRLPFRFLSRSRLPFRFLRHRPMAPRLPFWFLRHRPLAPRLPFLRHRPMAPRLPFRFLPQRLMG